MKKLYVKDSTYIIVYIYLILISHVLIDLGQGKNNPADSINEKKWEGKSANGFIDSVSLFAFEEAPKRSNYYYIRIYINLSEKVNPGDVVEMKLHPPNERKCNDDPSTHYNDYVDYDGQKKNISFEFCPRDLINPKLGNYSTVINVYSGDITDQVLVPFPWISVLYDLYDDPDSEKYDSIPKKAGVTIVKENITYYALQVKALKKLKVSLSVYPKYGKRKFIPNTRQLYLNTGSEKEMKWEIPCECLGSIGIFSCNESKIVPVLEEL
jgi:hypothetical protein